MKKTFKKCIVVVVFLLGSIGLTGCGLLSSTNEEEIIAVSSNSGTFYHGEYKIYMESSNTIGRPLDSDWGSYYKTDDDINVDICFYFKDGFIGESISALEDAGKVVEESVLWGNDCYFYTDDVTTALIELGEDAYLQVDFISEDGVIVEITEIPDEFVLTIGTR